MGDSQVSRMFAIQAEWERGEAAEPDGKPAIVAFFDEDDDRIIFRDQAALDEYVRGAMAMAEEDGASSLEIDVLHLVGTDGLCRISVNGQGHLPCTEHSEGVTL